MLLVQYWNGKGIPEWKRDINVASVKIWANFGFKAHNFVESIE